MVKEEMGEMDCVVADVEAGRFRLFSLIRPLCHPWCIGKRQGMAMPTHTF
jgi:hypothetical protein